MYNNISLKFYRRKTGKNQYETIGQIKVVGLGRNDVTWSAQNLVYNLCHNVGYCKDLSSYATKPLKECYECVGDFKIDFCENIDDRKLEIKKEFVKLKKKYK